MRLRTVAAEGAVRENILDNEEPSGGARRLPWRGTSARGICTLADYLTWVWDKSSGSFATGFPRALFPIIISLSEARYAICYEQM